MNTASKLVLALVLALVACGSPSTDTTTRAATGAPLPADCPALEFDPAATTSYKEHAYFNECCPAGTDHFDLATNECACKPGLEYDPAQQQCLCPAGQTYNPLRQVCEPDCPDPAAPFFNPYSQQCEACPPETPTWDPDQHVCTGTCPGGTAAGNDVPYYGAFELGARRGTFSFTYQTYTIKDRIQVFYDGQQLFDTGCVGAGGTVSLPFDGQSTSVIVQVTPNCAGESGTAWEFSVSCPSQGAAPMHSPRDGWPAGAVDGFDAERLMRARM